MREKSAQRSNQLVKLRVSYGVQKRSPDKIDIKDQGHFQSQDVYFGSCSLHLPQAHEKFTAREGEFL